MSCQQKGTRKNTLNVKKALFFKKNLILKNVFFAFWMLQIFKTIFLTNEILKLFDARAE